MKLLQATAIVCALQLVAGAVAHAGNTFLVQTPASFAQGVQSPDKVAQECPIDSMLANVVLERVSDHFPGSMPSEKNAATGDSKLLTLVITNIYAPAGGSWSGGKSVSVKVSVTQKGKTLATTDFSRKGGGAVGFSPIRGTCSTLERVSVALSKDIVKWLSRTAQDADSSNAAKESENQAEAQ